MLYKNKYLIAIYDLDDALVAVLDNVAELAKFLGKNNDQARSMLGHRFGPNGQLNSQTPIYIGKRRFKIHLIEEKEC
jgi:hypothetical protein